MATANVNFLCQTQGRTGSLNVLVEDGAGNVGKLCPISILNIPTTNDSTVLIPADNYVVYDVVASDTAAGVLQLYVNGEQRNIFIDLAAQHANNPGRPKLSFGIASGSKIEWKQVTQVTV